MLITMIREHVTFLSAIKETPEVAVKHQQPQLNRDLLHLEGEEPSQSRCSWRIPTEAPERPFRRRESIRRHENQSEKSEHRTAVTVPAYWHRKLWQALRLTLDSVRSSV